MATIEQIDKAFTRYYKSLGKDYHNQFALYCDDNGYEEEDIKEDIEDEAIASGLVEFDEHFPFKIPPKDEYEAMRFIHQLIGNFYYHPNDIQFKIPISYVIFHITTKSRYCF